ncbi:MAG: Bax inhibitor-1 family protein [Gemmatimonadota bacterium]
MTAPAQVITSAPARTGVDRATLVRRTYGLVLLGVVVTMLGVALAMFQPSLMLLAAQHPIIGFLGAFMLPLWLAQRWHREFPRNIGLTLLATLGAGVMISPALFVAERAQPGIVSQAGILTFTTFGALTVYAAVSRRDFSAWGGFFFVGVIVLIVTGLLNIFFQNETAALWIAGGTVLVFGGLLVFDTWRILRTDTYGPDDYVLAAVSIYLDLLNIFLAVLRLLGGRRN